MKVKDPPLPRIKCDFKNNLEKKKRLNGAVEYENSKLMRKKVHWI